MNINIIENDKIDTKQTNNIENTLADVLSIKIWDKNHKILNKSNSKLEWEKFGIKINNSIPVFYLKWYWGVRQWWYHPNLNFICVFENTKDYTLKHELIHSIEYKQDKTKELISFYKKVKNTINEDSFDSFTTFNFTKDIHEFIADWYSKTPFIEAMKKEKLYKEFLEETKYLFK